MNDIRTTPVPTAEHGAATRAALIEAARDIFSRNGFDGASVRRITSAADVNLGAVTYHFGSKRGLYEATLEEGLRPLLQRVRVAAEQPGSALDRMIAVVEAYFAHLADHGALPHRDRAQYAGVRVDDHVILDGRVPPVAAHE